MTPLFIQHATAMVKTNVKRNQIINTYAIDKNNMNAKFKVSVIAPGAT